MLRQSRLRYSAVPREVDRRTLLVGGGSSRECPGECLVTNIVAHVTLMDSPFDEFHWRGTRRGSWPHQRHQRQPQPRTRRTEL